MTFVSCSHWGMFPVDSGKLNRVASAISTEIRNRGGGLECIAEAVIRAYENPSHLEGRKRIVDYAV